MTTAPHQAHDTTTERVLCGACALSDKTWTLGCTTGPGQPPRERSSAARHPARLLQEVAQAHKRLGLPASAPGVRCEEAGRAGFWLHRFFQAPGLTNQVVDSSASAGQRRQRRAKSDGWDVRKLWSMLRRLPQGARAVWRVGHVPTVAAAAGRHRHRALDTLKPERASTTPRIQGWLRSQGRRLTSLSQWPEPLDALRLGEEAEMPRGRRRRWRRVGAHPQWRRAQRAALAADRRAVLHRSEDARRAPGRQRMPRQGMGRTGAWLVVRACFGGRAVPPRRAVGGGAGGPPTPYQSGARAREPGLTTSGQRQVRGMPTAWAWRWRRAQPERARSGLVAGARWERRQALETQRHGGGGAAGPHGPGARPHHRGRPSGGRAPSGVSGRAVRRAAASWGLVEAARYTSGPCQAAVGEMGAPPPGRPGVVARRREQRGTGGCPRTERRSWARRGLGAPGSR
jgi:hypothetical protein